MTAEEKNIIKQLIENITQLSGEDAHRDKEVDKLIREAVSNIDGGEYYLAQTVIAQTDIIRRLKERLSSYNIDAAEIKLTELEDEEEKPAGFIKGAAESAEIVSGTTQFINTIAGVSDDFGYEEFVNEDGDDPDLIDEDDFIDLDL